MAPFARIQCSAALVSRPPEKAMPTAASAGRLGRIFDTAVPSLATDRCRGETRRGEIVMGVFQGPPEMALEGRLGMTFLCTPPPVAAAARRTADHCSAELTPDICLHTIFIWLISTPARSTAS